MIIDSKKYNGVCSCGKEHKMVTELCVIEPFALRSLGKYAEECGLFGKAVAIYDENTYDATKGAHPDCLKEIILSPDGLHADNHGVELALKQLPDDCDHLIAVGSGTVHDITRYCAHKLGLPFVSCPTAASVDGFCSSVAAMTWNGFKKTFEAVAPRLVVADLDIISKAPIRLTRSGFGDMIGKYIALADWRISHLLSDEYFCDRIHNMTLDATNAVAGSATQIINGELSAYEKLTYGLLMSGLAMQLLGNSRCASGAEHHISHIIEMQPSGLDAHSDALHGEKVGVGTLICCKEYHRIANDPSIQWRDYPVIDDGYVFSMFGDKLSESVINENKADKAIGITASRITENLSAIKEIIKSIPTEDELSAVYSQLGIKSSLSDIGVNEDLLDTLLEFSPLVRNRVTLMRLRRATK